MDKVSNRRLEGGSFFIRRMIMLCKCGCGRELPNYSQNKTYIYGHRAKFVEAHKDEMIECACGCGKMKPRYDKCGAETRYLQGHNPASDKQKAIRAELNRQRKGIFKHRPETKQKISQSLIKFYEENPVPQERIDRMAKSKKGWNPSAKTRHNMSVSAKKRLEDPTNHHMYGKHQTKETRDKIQASIEEYYETHDGPMKGKTHTQETKDLLSEIALERLADPTNHPMYGKHQSYESRMLISMKRLGLDSQNTSLEEWLEYRENKYPIEFDNVLRDKIRKRDNNTCQICEHKHQYDEPELDVHHWTYNKEDLNHLVSLCHGCHARTNSKHNLWIIYFFLKFWVGRTD